MRAILISILALSAVACGGGWMRPDEGMTKASAAARTAAELGADRDPQAQAHMKRANDQIAEANALMKEGKHKRADFILQRAHADAELAVMLAKEHTAREEATEAQDKVKALKGGK